MQLFFAVTYHFACDGFTASAAATGFFGFGDFAVAFPHHFPYFLFFHLVSPPLAKASLKTGPSTPLTVSPSMSAFIITIQHTAPLRSTPMTANLSIFFMLALSRRSFGKTICPLSSTVTMASILQHSRLLVISFTLQR